MCCRAISRGGVFWWLLLRCDVCCCVLCDVMPWYDMSSEIVCYYVCCCMFVYVVDSLCVILRVDVC